MFVIFYPYKSAQIICCISGISVLFLNENVLLYLSDICTLPMSQRRTLCQNVAKCVASQWHQLLRRKIPKIISTEHWLSTCFASEKKIASAVSLLLLLLQLTAEWELILSKQKDLMTPLGVIMKTTYACLIRLCGYTEVSTQGQLPVSSCQTQDAWIHEVIT